ncbi:beta-glucosidase protein, partial [Violaceomyces palustris]
MEVNPLVGKLTLEEKIQLLSGFDLWRSGGSNRSKGLGYIKLTDGPNGARGGGGFKDSVPAALFPCPSCLGATFDRELAERMGKGIAEDSLSKHCHVSLAPTVNIQRDPRGGRWFESYSEDPVLSGELGHAWIKGCQGCGVGSTPKHFVANEAETYRRLSDSIMDQEALREIYLLPFQRLLRNLARDHSRGEEASPKAGVFRGQPACIMTAYNKLNGISCSENQELLQRILRGEWGFKGLIMSDWFGTYSTVQAIKAGLNLEMPGPTAFR